MQETVKKLQFETKNQQDWGIYHPSEASSDLHSKYLDPAEEENLT